MMNKHRILTIISVCLILITIGLYVFITTKKLDLTFRPERYYIEFIIPSQFVRVVDEENRVNLNSSDGRTLSFEFTNEEVKKSSFINWATAQNNSEQVLIPPFDCDKLKLRFPINYGRIIEELKIGDPNGPSIFCT